MTHFLLRPVCQTSTETGSTESGSTFDHIIFFGRRQSQEPFDLAPILPVQQFFHFIIATFLGVWELHWGFTTEYPSCSNLTTFITGFQDIDWHLEKKHFGWWLVLKEFKETEIGASMYLYAPLRIDFDLYDFYGAPKKKKTKHYRGAHCTYTWSFALCTVARFALLDVGAFDRCSSFVTLGSTHAQL